MVNLEIETLKGLFDVGGVVVVTAMLWVVWRRLNDVTDRLIDILGEIRAANLVRAAQHLNESQSSLNPQD